MTTGNTEGSVRFLRLLVLTLTFAMLIGIIVITILLVMRLTGAPVPLPDQIVLPTGAKVEAVTYGQGWIGVVGDDATFYLFDSPTGQLRQSVPLDLPEG